MRSGAFGRTLTVLSVAAAAGCSSSAKTPADDPYVLHACSTPPSGPVSAVPRFHRAVAATCEPTPDTANPDWTYAVAGMACTSDEQCRPDGSVRGFCRNGACTVDECLIDADCGDGHVCICSSHTPNGVLLNANACLVASCRTDSDCGAGGFCMPSAGTCFATGYFCHTAADTCVDPLVDCPSSCSSECTYFPDRRAFACPAPMVGGC